MGVLKKIKLIFVIVLFSCNNSKDVLPADPLNYFSNKIINIQGKIIETDHEILHGGSLRLINDSILAIKNLNDDLFLSLVNLNNNRLIKQLIRKGNGPGELLMFDFCPHIRKDSLLVYDGTLRSIYKIDVLQAIKNTSYQIEKISSFLEHHPITSIWTGNIFIGSGSDIDGRFSLYNQNGSYLKGCLNYSKPERYKDFPERVFSTGFQGCYTINPENRRIAFATFFSGSIHLFKYSDDNIETIDELNFYEPEMTRNNWVCAFSYNKTKVGFTAIDSDQKYIYLLYSGRMMKEHPDDDRECEYLLVIDWSGIPVKKYKLDKPLISMCLNGKSNKIYGISYLPETTIVQYDLE